MQDEFLRELRLQTSILRAAFKDRLDALAQAVYSDPISAAIVAHLKEHGRTRSGPLKEAVTKLVPQGTDTPNRTIGRRLAELENDGVIERSGQTANTEYDLSRLVS